MSGDKAMLSIRPSTSSQKVFDGVEVRFCAHQLSVSKTNSKSFLFWTWRYVLGTDKRKGPPPVVSLLLRTGCITFSKENMS